MTEKKRLNGRVCHPLVYLFVYYLITFSMVVYHFLRICYCDLVTLLSGMKRTLRPRKIYSKVMFNAAIMFNQEKFESRHKSVLSCTSIRNSLCSSVILLRQVEILLVASYYGNQDMIRQGGTLLPDVELTLYFSIL